MPIDYGSGIDFDYGTIQDSNLPAPVAPDADANTGDYADAKATYEAIKNGIDVGQHYYLSVREEFTFAPGITTFDKSDSNVLNLVDWGGHEVTDWSVVDADDIIFIIVPPDNHVFYLAAICHVEETFPARVTGEVMTTRNYWVDPIIIKVEAGNTSNDLQVVSAKALFEVYFGKKRLSSLKTDSKTIIDAINELSDRSAPTPVAPAEDAVGSYADAGYTYDQIQAATTWRKGIERTDWNHAQYFTVLAAHVLADTQVRLRWYHWHTPDSDDASYVEATLVVDSSFRVSVICDDTVTTVPFRLWYDITGTDVDLYMQSGSGRHRYAQLDYWLVRGTINWVQPSGTDAELPDTAVLIERTTAKRFRDGNTLYDLRDVYDLLPTKVSVAQGADNKGMVLGIGEDGNVLPVGADAFEFVGTQAEWDALELEVKKSFTKATIQGNVAPRDLEVLPATIDEIKALIADGIAAAIAGREEEVFRGTIAQFNTQGGLTLQLDSFKYLHMMASRTATAADYEVYAPLIFDPTQQYGDDISSPITTVAGNGYEWQWKAACASTTPAGGIKITAPQGYYRSLPSGAWGAENAATNNGINIVIRKINW